MLNKYSALPVLRPFGSAKAAQIRFKRIGNRLSTIFLGTPLRGKPVLGQKIIRINAS